MVFPVQSSDSDLMGSKNATADGKSPQTRESSSKSQQTKKNQKTFASPIRGISSGENFIDVDNRARGSDQKQQHKPAIRVAVVRYSDG